MLKKMIAHTLLAALAIGVLAIAYQAAAGGPAGAAGLWSASRGHDD